MALEPSARRLRFVAFERVEHFQRLDPVVSSFGFDDEAREDVRRRGVLGEDRCCLPTQHGRFERRLQ
jgi:hypothetical protein